SLSAAVARRRRVSGSAPPAGRGPGDPCGPPSSESYTGHCWGLAPGWRLGPRTPGRKASPRQISREPTGARRRGPRWSGGLWQEDPAKRHSSQEGDLHEGTSGGKTAPQGRDSWSWGLGVSPSPGTRQSAGVGSLVKEPCGPTSSQNPDRIIPQGPHAGEGPCWCPVNTRASSCNCCLAQHHRTPPEEKPLVCDHCGGQLLCWCCPRTQLCQVHTEDGSQEQRTGTQAFPKTLQVTLFQQKPLKELPQACRCHEGFTQTPCWLRRKWCGWPPLLCAWCGEHLGSDKQPQMAKGPLMCPQCGQVSGPGCGAPDPPALWLYICDQCSMAFPRTSSLLQHERIHTGERPYECTQCGKAFVSCSGLHRHQKMHSAEHHRHSRALAQRSCLLGYLPCGDCARGPRGLHGCPLPGRSHTSAQSAPRPLPCCRTLWSTGLCTRARSPTRAQSATRPSTSA
uniref:C2H2-type domain-containing protein n=1 Tax=Mustela putorius furo TaxID=9669 RepID=M3YAB3_MUSPF